MQDNKDNPNKEKLSPGIDSAKDKAAMKQEPAEINLPDVEDIPGQENFIPIVRDLNENTTITSADEEGDSILENHDDDVINENSGSNVTEMEKQDLQKASNNLGGDDRALRRAALQSTDEDGTPLNEGSFDKNISPDDLDVPGAALNDENEKIGEEDEENNEYSLGGDKHD